MTVLKYILIAHQPNHQYFSLSSAMLFKEEFLALICVIPI